MIVYTQIWLLSLSLLFLYILSDTEDTDSDELFSGKYTLTPEYIFWQIFSSYSDDLIEQYGSGK